MCTITFIPRPRGYHLGMNRDEQLTRRAALPPRKRIMNGLAVFAPSELGGGTWISLNEHRVTFALINWYSVLARVSGKAVSRGVVVNSVSATNSVDSAETVLDKLLLHRINPFRLIGIFPATNEITEWRWNMHQLVQKRHSWKSHQWISSGFNELAAQRVRGRTFRLAQKQKSAGSLDWLRRLHRSHAPETGPCSTCMHRADAATVSYTDISVSSSVAVMCYHAGAPCQNIKDLEELTQSGQAGHRLRWDRFATTPPGTDCRPAKNAAHLTEATSGL